MDAFITGALISVAGGAFLAAARRTPDDVAKLWPASWPKPKRDVITKARTRANVAHYIAVANAGDLFPDSEYGRWRRRIFEKQCAARGSEHTRLLLLHARAAARPGDREPRIVITFATPPTPDPKVP